MCVCGATCPFVSRRMQHIRQQRRVTFVCVKVHRLHTLSKQLFVCVGVCVRKIHTGAASERGLLKH